MSIEDLVQVSDLAWISHDAATPPTGRRNGVTVVKNGAGDYSYTFDLQTTPDVQGQPIQESLPTVDAHITARPVTATPNIVCVVEHVSDLVKRVRTFLANTGAASDQPLSVTFKRLA